MEKLLYGAEAASPDDKELLEKACRLISEADAVCVGAGAGLSTAAGFTYSGARFDKYFAAFRNKYGYGDMYSGGFYPYATPEEYWGFWARYIYCNRYDQPADPVYGNLLSLVKGRNYFVLTTNVDHRFQICGFDKKRLFYTQGDYGLFQCSVPCHKKTYDNETAIRRMIAEEKDLKTPASLLPVCPICGKPMSPNLRSDDTFVEDDGWQQAAHRYMLFIRENQKKKIVFLELGVGMNTPSIIKFPFWHMTSLFPSANYICVNMEQLPIPKQIQNKCICFEKDIAEVLSEMKAILSGGGDPPAGDQNISAL